MPKWKLSYKDLSEDFISSLTNLEDISILLNSKTQSNEVVKLRCVSCGNIVTKQLKKIMSNTGELYDKALLCGKCSRYGNKLWRLNEEDFPKDFVEFVGNDIIKEIVNSKDSQSNYYVKLVCPKCGKTHYNKLNNIMDRTGFIYHPNTYKFCNACSTSIYASSEEHRGLRVENSNREENRYKLTNYVKEHPECIVSPSRSSFELEIENYVHSLGYNSIHNRSILDGKEIDIYIPEKGIGIECNGLYWHTYPKKGYDYHKNKYELCKSKGIHLIQITDYQWEYNNDKIKMYLHDLLVYEKKRYYARKLSIKVVSSKEAKDFYNMYHLQGCNKSYSINYGLYDNTTLISCMSFDKSRVLHTVNKEGYYELHRYCVKSNCIILGGAEKLFKQFIKDYNPIEIKSFSDNDYFSGNIYKRLGFTETDYVRVYYWWNKNSNVLVEREKCQLKYLEKLFNGSYLTALDLKSKGIISNRETYIMENEGYLMYVTSGRTKWVYRI